MNTISSSSHPAFFPVLLVALMCLPCVFFYRKYLRISLLAALGVLLAAMGIGIVATRQHLEFVGRHLEHRDPIDRTFVPIACFLFVLVVVPFLVRLVRAWLLDDLTDAERRPNAEGMRAWLRGGNLLCALVIPALGWYGYGYSGWALLVVTLMALVARPLLASAMQSSDSGATESDVLRSDHDRIMRLLESGKIRADEASDLLSALGASTPAAQGGSSRAPLTRVQRITFCGGLLLVFGFLLPWFTINPGKELNRLSSQMNAQLGQVATDIFGRSVLQTEFNRSSGLFPNMKTGSMQISGADIGRGLGWVILICGIGATVLIALPEALPDRSIRRGLTLAAAGLGTALLIYLLGSNFRHASYGLLLVVVAYGCIAQGAFVRVGSDQAS